MEFLNYTPSPTMRRTSKLNRNSEFRAPSPVQIALADMKRSAIQTHKRTSFGFGFQQT